MSKKSLNANKSLQLMNTRCQSDSGNYLGCTLPPDPELLAEGWERRFIADARMAREALETYSELGYEVRLEPVDAEALRDECSGCTALFSQFCAIYTKKK